MIYCRDSLDEQVLPSVMLYYETMMTLLKNDFLDRYLQQQYFDERSNQDRVIDPIHYSLTY